MEAAGERLKKIRLEKGLSLEEVQKKTKIHLNILKAIEGDSISNLNPVYLKSFLKIYCKFLGVDPKEHIADYKETPARAGASVEAGTQKSEKLHLFKEAGIKFRSLQPLKKLKGALIFILAGAIAVWGLYSLGKFISVKLKQAASRSASSSLPVVKKQEPKRAPSPAQKTALKSIPLKKDSSSGIKLTIRARENCWIILKKDGHTVFNRILEKGRSESWEAKERIEFSLGNAGGVDLELNTQPIPKLGERGKQLKNIVITRDGGLQIPR
jgi:cytoskeletal protein RodZ